MKLHSLLLSSSILLLGISLAAQEPASPGPQSQPPASGSGPGARGGFRGGGMGWMGGRGVLGTVSEVASDHFTVKNEAGEIYTVHYSVNTRFLKQPPQRMAEGGMRTPPQAIKAADIYVGDAIAAGGEVDASAKSVGAVTIMKFDPERAREMRQMQANFGKTWLVGRVTAINETKVTLDSQFDHASHTFVADENTSFRKRREPITLADVQVGDNVRADGAVKDGVFTASTVMVMGPPVTGGPAPHEGPPPQ